ncbi:dehydrogenase [Novosphingobium marinum]|uniref:NAD(P)-dependent dehydrogenase (Short-subunit alcohol dehydrogenase family) n=1 Tax=Novosphingobium marinum TaxID=1514948 RepID=A0A7Y9XV90_9SPHN|nr:SDR family oxidoreductase [Novosphingobium marinum]NYH93751.1 NAD(P)-dependent dehydrogenase (short-subunit alcohol dehydrogenase family) [Novosphingobium marinum]GGC17020.1 dehydrogenase [Novosphingobium marinum]
MTVALPDCVALVTGAHGSIGREVVRAMKAAGATVIASDLGPEADHGGADRYYRHNVCRASDWEEIAGDIMEDHGRLDALVNVAAVSIVGKIEDTPLEEFQRVSAVNVDSIVIGVQELLPLLREGGKRRKGGASIVNFSSVGGLRGAAFNAAYCTSKAAATMLSKCMGAEFAALGYNIRCNSVHPGGIDTPMLGSIMDRYVDLGAVESREAATQAMAARHPIGRLGKPEEMAGGVVYLCSEAASFVTCSEFLMDGGFSQV